MKKRVTTLYTGLLIFLSSLIVCNRSNALLLLHQDTLWHIKLGEYIVNNRGIPTYDTFSIHNNLSFMAHEWLFDVIIYSINNLLGLFGIYLLPLICSVIAFAICVFYDKKNSYQKGVLLLVLVLVGLHKYTYAIPDTIAALLVLLNNIIYLSKMKLTNKIILNLALCILLVNIHGGMMTVLLIESLIFIVIDIVYARSFNPSKYKDHLAIYISGALCSLINPYGMRIYTYGFNMTSSNATKYITDWQRYYFPNIFSIIVFGICIVSIIFMNKDLQKYDKLAVTKLTLFCFWVAATLYYSRSINLLLYFFLIFESNYVVILFEKITSKLKLKVITKVCLIIFSTILVVPAVMDFVKNSQYSLDYARNSMVSNKMIKLLENSKHNVYNDFDLGGYLIFYNIPVYVDGRVDPYLNKYGDMDIFTEYEESLYDTKLMDSLVEKYNFRYVLIKNNNKALAVFIANPKWKIVEYTNYVTLFEYENEYQER